MGVLKELFGDGTPKQWLLATIVFLIGFFGFLLMAGEDNGMPILQWLAIKALGLALFIGCIKVGAILDKKGLLPEFKDEED